MFFHTTHNHLLEWLNKSILDTYEKKHWKISWLLIVNSCEFFDNTEFKRNVSILLSKMLCILNELTRIMKYTNCQVKLGMSNQVESNYHKCRIKSFQKRHYNSINKVIKCELKSSKNLWNHMVCNKICEITVCAISNAACAK